ncbi:MAG: hypothetical protein HC875_11200 [Anaerolineales bacterium]|nr:hypothetical protein [Anaerolineales bacterium]
MAIAGFYLKRMVGLGLPILLVAACSGDGGLSLLAPGPAATEEVQATATTLPPIGGSGSTIIANAPDPAPNNEAVVDTVEVLLLETFPVQANARVRGKFPDGCVTIERISQERSGNTFAATIFTTRQPDAGCIAQLQAFEQVLPLDVSDLAPGTYTVTIRGANSVSTTFQLSDENPAPATATPEIFPSPTATPSPLPVPANGSIGGVVWADFCRRLVNGAPSAGCIPDGQGNYRADGTYNNGEARIAGVLVALSRGGCASANANALQTTTDATGFYSFGNLEPGPYCVAIETRVEPNLSLLLPGAWTYPAPGIGRTEVILGAGENKSADFGWDDQFDQTPPGPAACVDQAAYVADVTIPDNTPIAPGAPFVKTWRIRNIGSCTWGSDYALVFTGGEPMGGQGPTPLPQPVQPGTEIELSLALVGPSAPGVYRGEWKLQNGSENLFGSRGNYPFYVQILVGGAVTPTAPAVLSIGGVVWEDFCAPPAQNNAPSGNCILADDGSGVYRADGVFNNGERGLAGVQVKLSVGECPGNNFVFSTATTGPDGRYRFDNLQAGPHCVSIDALAEPNASLLLPGTWTFPAPDTAGTTVIAGAEGSQAIDFGWDYQLR